ncbi:MAG: hypothetical protein JWR81_2209 [Pseudonocardia sp.]|nr:hypothetical protein [Pseudonocardia sp.]
METTRTERPAPITGDGATVTVPSLRRPLGVRLLDGPTGRCQVRRPGQRSLEDRPLRAHRGRRRPPAPRSRRRPIRAAWRVPGRRSGPVVRQGPRARPRRRPPDRDLHVAGVAVAGRRRSTSADERSARVPDSWSTESTRVSRDNRTEWITARLLPTSRRLRSRCSPRCRRTGARPARPRRECRDPRPCAREHPPPVR